MADELTDSIQKYWDAEGESDLLRFVRLKSTEAQHMLYVRKLSENMNLALVFDAETPFSTIRSQAGKLVKNLFDSSSGEKKPAPAAPASPAATAVSASQSLAPIWPSSKGPPGIECINKKVTMETTNRTPARPTSRVKT